MTFPSWADEDCTPAPRKEPTSARAVIRTIQVKRYQNFK